MNIVDATRSYEAWLGKQIPLIRADIQRKHSAMAEGVFPFLRATFFRWMQLWVNVCPEEGRAPHVLAVGDLHVENFGTWRDVEGRLVWGINDFDEAYELPYTIDLVRLAASAHIAIRELRLAIPIKDACDAILTGYRKAIQTGGGPFVLAEDHNWLRQVVSGVVRDPVHFWGRMDALRTVRQAPKSARRAIERMMPEPNLDYRIAHRIAGLGSLGRERYVALTMCRGGRVAREAKGLAPSACVWAAGGKASRRIHYQEALDRAIRDVDPFVRLRGRWIVRRLAPDCSRVELSAIPSERDESKLLRAMGFETANIHLGTAPSVKTIVRDLDKRKAEWLHEAATAMVKATTADWREWRASMRKGARAKAKMKVAS